MRLLVAPTKIALALDRRDRPAIRKIAALCPGEGAVVRTGAGNVAVYREPCGTLKAFDAACPHAGAVLEFEAESTTWVCPRHRARFDVDGSILESQDLVDEPLQPFGLHCQ